MDYAIILMIFNFIKSISEFLASILIIICAVKYLKKTLTDENQQDSGFFCRCPVI